MRVTEKQLKAVHALRVWYQKKMSELRRRQLELTRQVRSVKEDQKLSNVKESIKEL